MADVTSNYNNNLLTTSYYKNICNCTRKERGCITCL